MIIKRGYQYGFFAICSKAFCGFNAGIINNAFSDDGVFNTNKDALKAIKPLEDFKKINKKIRFF